MHASGIAAYAAGIRIRPFRHFVADIDDHSPGHYRTFSDARTIIVGAGYRVAQYGLASAAALRIAVDTLGPVLEPFDGYSLTPPFILKATAGLWLHVHIDPDGVPRATLGRDLPVSEGVMIDVGALAATVIERLAIASAPPLSDVDAGLRAAKGATNGGGRDASGMVPSPQISNSNKGIQSVNIREIRGRREAIRAEMHAIHAAHPDTLPGEAQTRWAALEAETATLAETERRQAFMDDMDRRTAGQHVTGSCARTCALQGAGSRTGRDRGTDGRHDGRRWPCP